jgi:hypothetical protein
LLKLFEKGTVTELTIRARILCGEILEDQFLLVLQNKGLVVLGLYHF